MDIENQSPKYYISENGEVAGPFQLEELRGKINAETMIFIEDGIKWIKAEEIPELQYILFPPETHEVVLEEQMSDIASIEEDSVNVVSHSIEDGSTKTAVANAAPKEKSKNTILIVFGVLIFGGLILFLNKNKITDFRKWKDAEDMYCYISTLRIRSDTTTSDDYNILSQSLKFGEEIQVVRDPLLDPWCEVKFTDKYSGDETYGYVNSYFLMNKKDFRIFETLINNSESTEGDQNAAQDRITKLKQISQARYRKSLVNYVRDKYYNTSSENIPATPKIVLWAIERKKFIKTGENRYAISDTGNEYVRRDYAMFLLTVDGNIEIPVFVYENGIEYSSKIFSNPDELTEEEFDNFLEGFGLDYD